MTKIQALLKTMQGRSTRYLMHLDRYISLDGGSSVIDSSGTDTASRDMLFIRDMIGLLDGPAQRAAEAELAVLHEDLKTMVRSLMRDLRVVDHIVTLNPGTADSRNIVASTLI